MILKKKMRIRKEVLDYMENLGRESKEDLDESELAYIKIMEEEPLLFDKVQEVKKGT